MPTHIFFDLDNTLVLSRTRMTPEHGVQFKKLCEEKDVVVVSGAQESQIRAQIPDELRARFYILGQTGNQAFDREGTVMWQETFTDEQTKAVMSLIEDIKTELAYTVKDPNDLVENRGSQISYSPIGHHEDLQKKYAFDPGNQKRLAIISRHHEAVTQLNALGVDVIPGGTTCFDFFLAGRNKGFNVARLLEREHWDKKDCIYLGDGLFTGGNDESVVGIIPTHPIKNPDETFAFVETLLAH